MSEETKPLSGPISVERVFRVEGKRVTVRVTLPAVIASEIGMENMLACARRILVEADSSEARVAPVRTP